MPLKWAGSHIAVAFSPDGKYLMSSMQENQLHGWRLADSKDLKMGGYPAKVKSLVFFSKGLLLATSGAPGVVVWPFAGANGPMGKEAAEIGFDESALVARVAAAPDRSDLAAGLDDGRVWVCDVATSHMQRSRPRRVRRSAALALSPKGDRVAWGDEGRRRGGGNSRQARRTPSDPASLISISSSARSCSASGGRRRGRPGPDPG